MRTKLLRKFRARFDYKFETKDMKDFFHSGVISVDIIELFDKKTGKSCKFSLNKHIFSMVSFECFMHKAYKVIHSRKRRKLLEKKRIKDNHKRWKDEF